MCLWGRFFYGPLSPLYPLLHACMYVYEEKVVVNFFGGGSVVLALLMYLPVEGCFSAAVDIKDEAPSGMQEMMTEPMPGWYKTFPWDQVLLDKNR